MNWMGSSPPVIFMVSLTREGKRLLKRKIIVRSKIGKRTLTRKMNQTEIVVFMIGERKNR